MLSIHGSSGKSPLFLVMKENSYVEVRQITGDVLKAQLIQLKRRRTDVCLCESTFQSEGK